MARDYIPRGDADFDTYQAAFIAFASANMAALGLAAANITSLTTAQTAWNSGYTAHVAARAAAHAARNAKDAAHEALEAVIRQMANKVQGSLTVTAAQKLALGISPREGTRAPIGVPTTRPVVRADTSQRLQIGLSWKDQTTPTRSAKPRGVLGAQIYVKVDGPQPTDVDDCTFVAFVTSSPYVAHFDGGQTNKTAHFILRWTNTKGEVGPISETVSATVPG